MKTYEGLRSKWGKEALTAGAPRKDLEALLQAATPEQRLALTLMAEWVERWVNTIGDTNTITVLTIATFAEDARTTQVDEIQPPLPFAFK